MAHEMKGKIRDSNKHNVPGLWGGCDLHLLVDNYTANSHTLEAQNTK